MSDVLRRKMFAVSVEPKKDAMNVGIMSGFSEPEEQEEYEGPEMDEGDNEEGDEYEDRRPDNLEIIANNLRGDFKSLDNRYAELAMKVGEEAAAQTPPEVIALMQPQMAQQMQAGIAGLPQAQQVMPGASGAPPMPAAMDQGPGPMPQMAKGGYIGKYQFGGSPAVQALSLGEQLRNAYVGSSGVLPQQTANIAQGPFANFLARSGQYGIQLAQRVAPYIQSAGQTVRNAGSALGPYGRPLVIGGTALTAIPFLQKGNQIIQEAMGTAVPSTPSAASQLSSTSAATVPMLGPDGRVITDQAAYPKEPVIPVAPPPAAAPAAGETKETGAAAPVPAAPIKPAETIAAAPTVAEEETEDSLFEKELGIREKRYAAVLGGDKNYAQAQALFALADAGLKLAGPGKGNLAARISKAFENVPAAMQKLGAEEEASRRAVKLAAIKGAEEAVASQNKFAQAKYIADLKSSAGLTNTIVALQGLGVTDPTTLQVVARGIVSKVYTPEKDELGNIVIGPITIPARGSRNAVAAQPSLQNNPLVLNVTPSKGTVPKSLQKDLLKEKQELEGGLSELNYAENILADKRVFGPASFVVGLSNKFLVPMFGDSAPFSDISQEKQELVANTFKGRAARLTALSDKYPVYELKRLSDQYEQAGDFFTSPQKFIAQINAARAQVMTRISDLDSKLYGTDAIEYRAAPVGAKDDPYTKADTPLLKDLFARRPEALVYYRVDKESPITLIDRTMLRD